MLCSSYTLIKQFQQQIEPLLFTTLLTWMYCVAIWKPVNLLTLFILMINSVALAPQLDITWIHCIPNNTKFSSCWISSFPHIPPSDGLPEKFQHTYCFWGETLCLRLGKEFRSHFIVFCKSKMLLSFLLLKFSKTNFIACFLEGIFLWRQRKFKKISHQNHSFKNWWHHAIAETEILLYKIY